MTTPTGPSEWAMEKAALCLPCLCVPCAEATETFSRRVTEWVALALDAARRGALEDAEAACLQRAHRFKASGDSPGLPPIIAIVPQTRGIEAYDCATAIRALAAKGESK